jgi:hypothetical protein
LTSSDTSGGGFDGYFEGDITITSVTGVTGSVQIPLWAKARDNAGHEDVTFIGDYDLTHDCP